MDKIRIGVVGLRFGQHHVRTLANMGEAELVAVADSNPSLPEGLDGFAAGYGARSYRDGIEMMEREELDAVSLCVSPARREELIDAATSREIPLFVEKPWAADLAQGQRLAAICREREATVMTAFSFRFLPAIVRLQALMAGELGPGWMLNGSYVFGWLPPAEHWLWDPEKGGGFFNENSCHLFDAVCALMGDPVALTAEVGNFAGSPSAEAGAIVIRFASGGIAALTCGGVGGGGERDFPRLELVTANGQARLAGREHIWEELSWTTRDGDQVHRVKLPSEGLGDTRYTRALRHFFECLRTGQKPEATVEDGVRSVALAMGVYESARTGGKVELAW